MPTDLPKIVAFLNARQTPADLLCGAADIRAMSLTNYLNKTNLELCSKKPGRGRPRDFCLIDCYAVLLMHVLTKRLNDYEAVASAVNQIVFEEARQLMLSDVTPFRTDGEMKSALCSDVGFSPACFWQRDADKPWFLCERAAGGGFVCLNDFDVVRMAVFASRHGVLIVNLTSLFSNFDERLAVAHGYDVQEARRHEVLRFVAGALAKGLRPDDD